MNLVETKILVSILLGILRFIFGVMPIKIYSFLMSWDKDDTEINKRHQESANCLIVRFQSFSGGILFATCFLHMIPDVRESVSVLFNDLSASADNNEAHHDFPFSELIICIGFFMVYFIEELTHWCVHNIKSDNRTEPVKNDESKDIQSCDVTSNNDSNSNILKIDEITQCSSPTPNVQIILAEQKHMTECMQDKQKNLRGFLVIVALSVHSIFEGLSIGVQKSTSNIWYMFTAIVIHAATILYCVGFEMAIEGVQTCTIIINIIILACGSPLGVLIGLLFTIQTDVNERSRSVAVCLLEGISAGTVLYITFFEVLNREKLRQHHRLSRCICILAGFGIMIAIQVFEI